VRSGEVGSALNQSCTEMNGTKVEVRRGHICRRRRSAARRRPQQIR
jgi:hypothetical protein